MFDPNTRLPTADELPDSDNTPVDNELQDLIPSLLKRLLASIWADRWDWFWGTDMGFYFEPQRPAIVPDGLLALGVPRVKDENLRRSYVLWEEKVVPVLVLEVISRARRGEYQQKKRDYTALGIRYYVIYNTLQKVRDSFEVYRLEGDKYVRLKGNPVWLPEVGLGIGAERGVDQGVEREWLYWYDAAGRRYPTAEERAEAALQKAEAERERAEAEQERAKAERERAEAERERAEAAIKRAEQLAERLKALGLDPNTLD